MNRPLTIEKRGELIYISNGVSYIYIDKELLNKLNEIMGDSDE